MNTLLISGVIVTDNAQCLDVMIYLNSHLVLC